ncbi:MAG: hypothetical protein ACHQCI_02745 [Solirubrobacterales bacterium]
MTDPALAGSLLEDYKLKVSFAVEQLGRMQTQFQVMLTLQAALATTLIVSNTGSLTKGAKWIVLLELVLSIAWVMVGVVGKKRADLHRADLEEAGQGWAKAAGLGQGYKPVGSGPKVVRVGVWAPASLTLGWLVLLIVLLTG